MVAPYQPGQPFLMTERLLDQRLTVKVNDEEVFEEFESRSLFPGHPHMLVYSTFHVLRSWCDVLMFYDWPNLLNLFFCYIFNLDADLIFISLTRRETFCGNDNQRD